MYNYTDNIAKRLGEREKKMYSRIYAPVVVATPPQDTRNSICVCADGEIRVYGEKDKTVLLGGSPDTYRPVYLSSRDGGLTWAEYDASHNDIGSCVYVPWTGKYVTVRKIGRTGIYRYISDIGPGDTNPDVRLIVEANYTDLYLPYVLEDCKRLFVTTHKTEIDDQGVYRCFPTLFISDDGGDTWKIKDLPSCPRFKQTPPHKGVRWENNGSEPSLTRLKNGVLWLVLRTSQDYMYECFSYDNGDTWTEPVESRFHMTLTTPFPFTMRDGRVLLFWNNTHPLPEQDKTLCQPPVPQFVIDGIGEDVFTNRDAAHVAISEDDGKTFFGCRESILNAVRNNVDFRTYGSMYDSNDRSVHQFQAIELPMGKILLSAGQHEDLRKLLIFDVRWLYETTRTEDFKSGMKNVSVHGYLKSVSGSWTGRGIPGHCQWNRIPSVYPAPDPAGTVEEAMQFVYNDDPRLVNGLSGMAWNFPAANKGRLEVQFYRKTKGLQLCLADEWINPTDEYAYQTAEFCLSADEEVPADQWVTLTIEWDCEKREAVCKYNDVVISKSKMQHNTALGISYLHLQTLARSRDFEGCYIRRLEKI